MIGAWLTTSAQQKELEKSIYHFVPAFTTKSKKIFMLRGLMHVHTTNSILIIQGHLNG